MQPSRKVKGVCVGYTIIGIGLIGLLFLSQGYFFLRIIQPTFESYTNFLEKEKISYNGIILFEKEVLVLKTLESLIGQSIPYRSSTMKDYEYEEEDEYKDEEEGEDEYIDDDASIDEDAYIEHSFFRYENRHVTTLKLRTFKVIEEIPESIKDLTELEHLYINNNFLKQIPDSIGSFSKLKSLSLHSNKLSHLPRSISNLKIYFG